MSPVLILALLSVVVGATSLTLTRARIFKPIRDHFKGRFVGKLLNCPYCTSYWVSGATYAIYRPEVFGEIAKDVIFGVNVLVVGGAVVAWLIYQCHSAIAPPEE